MFSPFYSLSLPSKWDLESRGQGGGEEGKGGRVQKKGISEDSPLKGSSFQFFFFFFDAGIVVDKSEFSSAVYFSALRLAQI